MILAQFRRYAPRALSPSFQIAKLVQRKTNKTVRSGPFRGMKYVDTSVGSAYIPKLLGIYERELHEVIRKAITSSPDTILDIGAAEGYYAVGLALTSDAKVMAFECEDKGRELMHQMALQNGSPTNLDIAGLCTPEVLRTALAKAGRAIIIMDVEGAEDGLLDPDRIPHLKAQEIIVEMHDFIIPGITERITCRFARSHLIERIDQVPRSVADMPFTSALLRIVPARYIEWAVSEHRPVRMHWLHMMPRVGSTETSGTDATSI